MNNKSIFLIVAIAATIASGVAIASTVALGVVPAVYADKDTSKNDFGQKASEDLAKDGEMGQHSSDPSGDGTSNPDPRSGIGNVFNPGDPKDSDLSKHPSDTINELCRLDPNNDACNPNP